MKILMIRTELTLPYLAVEERSFNVLFQIPFINIPPLPTHTLTHFSESFYPHFLLPPTHFKNLRDVV